MDTSSKLTADIPTQCGLWEMRCMETNDLPERVAITKRLDCLIVHDDALGETVLSAYHNGLTNLRWRHIS